MASSKGGEDSDLKELNERLDSFLAEFATANINRKANEIGRDLIKFLDKHRVDIDQYEELSSLIEGLGLHWVANQNPKVTQHGYDALLIIAESSPRFKSYSAAMIHHVIARLGDTREPMREGTRSFLVKINQMDGINTTVLIDKLAQQLNAKNSHMAIEAQRTLVEILSLSRGKKFATTTLLDLVKAELICLHTKAKDSDSASSVLLYVGERMGIGRLIDYIEKEASNMSVVSSKKVQIEVDKLRAHEREQMTGGAPPPPEEKEEVDFTKPSTSAAHAQPAQKPSASAAPATSGKQKTKPGMATKGPVTRAQATVKMSSRLKDSAINAVYSGAGGSGECDEPWFWKGFEDTPVARCLHRTDLDHQLKGILETLKGNDIWEVKMNAVKKIRSVIKYFEGYDAEIQEFTKTVSYVLATLLKDLRSQVVREVCLTVAYMSKELNNRLDAHPSEVMLIQLMTNVMNHARVISQASYFCVTFMLRSQSHGRLINCLVHFMNTSKSTGQRTVVCEFLELILLHWPVNRLETYMALLQDAIRKGLAESSTEGRLAARRAFWAFRKHFLAQSDVLLNSVDLNIRKAVLADEPKKCPSPPWTEPPSGSTSKTRLQPSRSATAAATGDAAGSRRYSPTPSLRSNSAIDLQAVQRAKARQQYAALARQKVGSGASLPRATKRMESPQTGPSGAFVPERTGRTRNRVAGVSHSQPSSRSGSPSSRIGYHTYNLADNNSLGYQSRRLVPRSQGTSRETSPNRFGSKSSLTNLFGPKRRLGERPPIQPSRPVMAQQLLAQSLEAEHVSFSAELFDGETGDNLGHKVSPRKTSYRPFEDHSDDSDASSLCSERSFDSYRRTSDDIAGIISNCESTHWSDRKEGLVGLQHYLQSGNTLIPADLKRVTDTFTRMFSDSHTKVFSLFLDTLNEVISVHRNDLHSWLYVLLTRLLNKLGADLLGSIQNKIHKSLKVVRVSFPPEQQMSSVLRFLTDPTQTPNLRVKTAALNYITKLAAIAEPSHACPEPVPGLNRDLALAALHKMIGWTMGDGIKQGNELRRASQEAIIALFNLNTPKITLRMAQLPKEYQEAAGTFLRGRVRRGSSSSGGGTATNSPPSPSPRMASPSPTLARHLSRPQDSDGLNPEEIYRSLRKTTAEIQNYTYEAGTEKPPDKDNTTSKDSGISQLSGTEALEEAMEELSIQSSSSSNATTATLTNRVLTVRDCNGMDMTDNTQQDDGPIDEHEAMRKIVEALKSPPDSDNGENISIISDSEKRASLGQLTRLIRDSSVTVLQENFKALLRILLGNLGIDSSTRDIQSRILVLNALSELLKKRALTEYFNHYVELLILKVLSCCKDSNKEIVRAAESCANTIVTTLSPAMVIRVLAPLIQTGEFPLNLAAIKMLTRLVDACGRDPVFNYLPDLMPGLLQAYDNQESSVRKSAVFCMVSLNTVIGDDDLRPHLAALNGSKLKLLHLYIRRAQQGASSIPTSPRNHPPPSS